MTLALLLKRILRKYGDAPDKQEIATLTVREQAEVLSANWATATDDHNAGRYHPGGGHRLSAEL